MSDKLQNTESFPFAGYLPSSMAEIGFLMALVLAPFGPVLRYLGWLIAIIGLLREKCKFKIMIKNLPGWSKVSFSILIGWGAIITVLSASSLSSFLKGWSLSLEFVFSVLLACFVLADHEAFRRWKMVSRLFLVFLGLNGYLWMSGNGYSTGVFSSFPTFYSTIAIPLAPLAIFPILVKSGSIRSYFFNLVVVVFLALMLLSGLSSGSMLAILISTVVMFVLIRPSAKEILLATIKTGLIAIIVVSLALVSGKQDVFWGKMKTEIGQILNLNDTSKLTSGRNLIWKDSIDMAKDFPLGTGWGFFRERFMEKKDRAWFSRFHSAPSAPHNDFLSVLVEGGVLSFFAYVLFWACLVRILFNSIRNCGAEYGKTVLLSSLLVSVFMFSLVGGIFDERKTLAIYFWTVFGAILAQSLTLEKGTGKVV